MYNEHVYREQFGNDLKTYWLKAWLYRKDLLIAANKLYEDYKEIASENDPLIRKPCRLDDGNFSNLIRGQGSPQRDLGKDKYEPEKLLWIVAALMAHFCISSISELKTFLDLCPECFVNDDGREWVKQNARHVLEKLGYVWPEVTTDMRIPSVRTEPAKPKQSLRKTTLRPFTQEEIIRDDARSNTDKLFLDKISQAVEEMRQETGGRLPAAVSTRAIGIIVEHTQIE